VLRCYSQLDELLAGDEQQVADHQEEAAVSLLPVGEARSLIKAAILVQPCYCAAAGVAGCCAGTGPSNRTQLRLS
jgi:hypothetical protein